MPDLRAIPHDADTYYLHDIALRPECRGTGVGRAALDAALLHARTAGFTDITLIAVGGADTYWAKQGFAVVEGSGALAYGAGTCLMRRATAPLRR